MKIFNKIIDLKTAATLDFTDITDRLGEILKEAGVKDGVVNIQSLHTTMALIVNEAEPLLIGDMKKNLEKVAPRTMKYLHDNFDIRTTNMCDGECANGHAHCKSMYLNTSIFLNIIKNRLQLGTWQRVFAVELDRSRPRRIAVQVIGR